MPPEGGLTAIREGVHRAEAAEVSARSRVAALRREVLQTRQGLAVQRIQAAKKSSAKAVRKARDEYHQKDIKAAMAGVQPANERQIQQLSKKMNEKMEELFTDPLARTWFRLFRFMDKDGSGLICFVEFLAMVRQELRISPRELSDSELYALFLVMDIDSSGFIKSGEFGAFMRRGLGEARSETDSPRSKSLTARQAAARQVREDLQTSLAKAREQQDALGEQRIKNAKARRSVAQRITEQAAEHTMRKAKARAQCLREEKDLHRHGDVMKALKLKGVQPASIDQVRKLSEHLLAKMEELFTSPHERTWFRLFRYMDHDVSGLISYTEFSKMVREELLFSQRQLPEAKLQSVWLALDTDGSGTLKSGEFGAFMRLGIPEEKQPEVLLEARRQRQQKAAAEAREEAIEETARRAQHLISGYRHHANRYEAEAKLLEKELESLATSAAGAEALRGWACTLHEG